MFPYNLCCRALLSLHQRFCVSLKHPRCTRSSFNCTISHPASASSSTHSHSLNTMSRPAYDGASRPHPEGRKQYKASPEERAIKRVEKKERLADFNKDITSVWQQNKKNISAVAEKHGRSEVYVGTLLGQTGAELTKRRGASAYNGWTKFRLEELNAGNSLVMSFDRWADANVRFPPQITPHTILLWE